MSTQAIRQINLPAPASPPRRSNTIETQETQDLEGQTISFRLPLASTTIDAPEELIIKSPSTVAHSQARATKATLAAAEDLSRTGFGDGSEYDSNNTTGGGGKLPPAGDQEIINFERSQAAKAKDNKTLWALGLATVGFIATSLVVHLTNLFGDLKKPLGLLSDSISIFLATCFGAGLLSLRNGIVDSSEHTYSNS